jgi:predicted membrane-bound spermidine synthase
LTKPSLRYLYLTVFTGGLTTLGVELSASRLLGTVFGTSNIIWATIIGLILLYLTIGYFLGGRIADRSPYPETFYRTIAWGAFTTALIPIIARPVLRLAAEAVLDVNAPILVGAFVVVLILFAVPITLLATVSPFAIRLALHSTDDAGRVSGRMYAISTVGSLIGTFLPVLVLIPIFGTNLTFLSFAGFLWLVAWIGLFQINRAAALKLLWMPVVIIVLAVLLLRGPLRPPPRNASLIYETESTYNYIQVARWGAANILLLNEGQGVHSMYFPDSPDYLVTNGTWDYFVIAPFFNEPPVQPAEVDSLALVGLAGGTIAKQYTYVYGPIPIDGMEIDPKIVEVGREYFGMHEENLNVIVQDARTALAASDNTYDVIGIDAYRLPYVPWNLSTVEFFQDVRDHLSEDGVAVINVGRTAQDRRLIATFAATMGQVFASVHVLDVPRSCNSIMYATVQPTDADNLRENLAQLPVNAHPFLLDVLNRAIPQLRETPSGGTVLTDDRAAVELMTDLILVNFVLSGSTALPCS